MSVFWLVSMVFQGSFMVFHGFWLMVNILDFFRNTEKSCVDSKRSGGWSLNIVFLAFDICIYA